MQKLKPLPNELYEFYPAMSAQTHEEQVKAYAKSHLAEELNTRPAAPVEGLETLLYVTPDEVEAAKEGYSVTVRAKKVFLSQVIELVTRSQAEAIIAVERAALAKEEADHTRSLEERDRYHDVADKLAQAIADRYQADIGEHSNINEPWQNALNLIEADNAALTARVKEFRAVQPQLVNAALAQDPFNIGVNSNASDKEEYESSQDYGDRKLKEALAAASALGEQSE